MGYMRHHAIIVTSFKEESIRRAHNEAGDWGFPDSMLGQILKSPMNEYYTFMIGPDGSKEGWEESNEGDDKRINFIRWMDTQRYDDGSSPLDWVEVQYGDDERETKIVSHSDEPALNSFLSREPK